MALLGNGKVDADSVKKLVLENSNGISLGGNVIFKRRSVSAKRDFPPRCGRHALEDAAKLRADSMIVRLADFRTLEKSGFSVEPELPKLSVTLNDIESSNVLHTPNFVSPRVSATSNQIASFEPLDNSASESVGKFLKDVPASSNREKDSEQLLDISVPGKATAKVVPKTFPTRKVSCTRLFPPGCGRSAPPIAQKEKSQERLDADGMKAIGDLPLSKADKFFDGNNNASKSEINANVESQGEVQTRHDLVEPKHEEKTEDIQVERDKPKEKDTAFVKELENGENIHVSTLKEESSELHTRSLSTIQNGKREIGSVAVEVDIESGRHKKASSYLGRKFKKETICENAAVRQWESERPVSLDCAGTEMAIDTEISASEEKFELAVDDIIQKHFPKEEKSDGSSTRNTNIVKKRAIKRKPRVDKPISEKIKKASVIEDGDSLPQDSGGEQILDIQEHSLNLFPFGPDPSGKSDCPDPSPRRKVRETLRIFHSLCRKLLREEETKSNRQTRALRCDLIAAKLMKERNKCVNMGAAILGPVPGVEVGDEFHYRVELAIIGLHRLYQAGIDYTKQGRTILATSVVNSGVYADDIDNSDVMIYSGQGGKPAGGDKKPEDQKLERGNLALKNCVDAQTPVRVIHGYKESSTEVKGKILSTFTYSGLYLVEKYWQEKTEHGCLVFKFQMRRLPGQPELAMKEVKKTKKSAVREGLCLKDISQGKERKPVCAVNTVDNDHPPPFKYATKMIYPSWYKQTPPVGCDCTGGCADSKKCVCVMKNGGEIPFNYNGAIVEAKPLVYECGPSCKCPPSCYNRVSQHGLKIQLEIFKTKERGWGVRSLNSIPSGSFICEYTGELLTDKEAEQRTGNDEYLFDIGNNNEKSLTDEPSDILSAESQLGMTEKVLEDGEYTIDAAECGNVGRFINHSCSPNLYAQNVLYDHEDKRMPHIMFFAVENIPPLQELAYHYNYTIGQVHDSNGNVKQKNCYCGSSECTGRLY